MSGDAGNLTEGCCGTNCEREGQNERKGRARFDDDTLFSGVTLGEFMGDTRRNKRVDIKETERERNKYIKMGEKDTSTAVSPVLC